MKASSKGRFIVLLMGIMILMLGKQVCAEPVPWDALGSNEQAVLKPFEHTWGSIPDSKQQTLRRWAAKSPDERARIKQRYNEWRQLPPVRQQQIIRELSRYRQMPADKRARLEAWHQWVRRLPVTEQQKLHDVWPTLSEPQRKAYMQDLQNRYGRR